MSIDLPGYPSPSGWDPGRWGQPAEGQASGATAIPGPTAGALRRQVPPPRPGWPGLGWAGSRWAAVGGAARGAGWEQRLVSLRPRPQPKGPQHHDGGSQAPEARAASSLPRCGPPGRGRGRTEGDEAAAILEHLESGAEAARARAPGTGVPGRAEVHLARPPRSATAAGGAGASEKPKKRYRKKLKKYGKGRHSTTPPVPWVGHPTSARELKSSPYNLTLSASLPCPAHARHCPPAPRHSLLEPRNGSGWAVG